MNLQEYTKEWLEILCKDSCSYAQVLKRAGRKPGGGNQEVLKKKINDFGIDVSHFTGKLWSKGKTRKKDSRIKKSEKYTLSEVFKKNSPVTQRMLRGYVRRHNLLEYKCKNCGCNGNWQGGTIALELHHEDGNNKNNELSNLNYLCPNCHALTETYRGRNIAN